MSIVGVYVCAFMWMSTYMCMCLCVSVVCVYVSEYIYVYVFVHTYVSVSVCMCVFVWIRVCVCVWLFDTVCLTICSLKLVSSSDLYYISLPKEKLETKVR